MTQWADDMLAYTGIDEIHDVYTVTLHELIEDGIFKWSDINWKSAAYDDATYNRLCEYFVERFRFREIGMEPYKIWAQYLKRKLVYEIAPKYNKLYALLASDFDIRMDEDEYYKRRSIYSDYPQTQMSGNSDYASNGTDEEWERIRLKNPLDAFDEYQQKYQNIDEQFMDELECMFISSYAANVNAL